MACGSLLSEEDLCRFRTKKCRRLTSGSCEFGITRCQYSHNQYWSRRCPIYLSDRSFIRYIHVLCPCVTIKPTGGYDGPLPCGKNRCKQLLNCLLDSAATAALDGALPQEQRQNQPLHSGSNLRKGAGGSAGGKDKDSASCFCPHPGEEVIENTCGRGGECPFAHSLEEILYHPLFYKMVICGNYRKGVCDTYYCPYVHGLAERRRPTEYKLPFTTGIDIPPLPFVTVVTRIEKKKESVAPPLEASLASTASASDGACCSPQTERTDRSVTGATGKYGVFFRDRRGCSKQEGGGGRWRKSLGRSSSRRSGGAGKRDFHRKGSLPSHLSSATLQATIWNTPVRGETSLLESLEPVAEEVADPSDDFPDACNNVDAFTKGHANTNVRSFADAFAKGHADACVKGYADAYGETTSNTCTKEGGDASTGEYPKVHEPEGGTLEPGPKTAATAAADLFSTSLLPASSPMGLMGHEVLLNSNLLEGDLTAEALAPFLSVNTLQTNTAADMVSTLPHVQLVAAALELYDNSTSTVINDESGDTPVSALTGLFGTGSGTRLGCGLSEERRLPAHQNGSGPDGITQIRESNTFEAASSCKGEYAAERDGKGVNSDSCQTGELPPLIGETEDVSPTASSPGTSCWLPFLSPCIVSPDTSMAEPLTARVRAAGADVLEKLFAGAKQCAADAGLGKFAGTASGSANRSAISPPTQASRRLSLPPGIAVPALMFSAPSQHSGTADTGGVHRAIDTERTTVLETAYGNTQHAGSTFSKAALASGRASDIEAFTGRDGVGGDGRQTADTLGTGSVTDGSLGHLQQPSPQNGLVKALSDEERWQSFREPEAAAEKREAECRTQEPPQRGEEIDSKKEPPHSANSSLETKPSQEEARIQHVDMASCQVLQDTATTEEKEAVQKSEEKETEKKSELPFLGGKENNASCPVPRWTLTDAVVGAGLLCETERESNVQMQEREEGILAGDECGCPLAESVLQSLEKGITLLTATGWKGSVRQLKRMQKAAGELWGLIHCGTATPPAEGTGTSSTAPFSGLFSFLDTKGGDCVTQRCTTALSSLLPGKAQPAEK